jgi:hypothetical protein
MTSEEHPSKKLSVMAVNDNSHRLDPIDLKGTIVAAVETFHTGSDPFVREEISKAVFEGLQQALEEIEDGNEGLFLKIGIIHAEFLKKIAKEHPNSVFSRILAKSSVVKHNYGSYLPYENTRSDSGEADLPEKAEAALSGYLDENERFVAEMKRSLEIAPETFSATQFDPQIRITPAQHLTDESYAQEPRTTLDLASMTEQDLLAFLCRLDGKKCSTLPPSFIKSQQRKSRGRTGSGETGDFLNNRLRS